MTEDGTEKVDDAAQIAHDLTPGVLHALKRYMKRMHSSKYAPHQGKKEAARRLRQIRNGTLRGGYIVDEARYHAHGLSAPTDVD